MTSHDQISAYIDNELSGEQEQDFLISLASSDGLRKSFRSELVLKNVIHRDEVLTSPSREMRGAVLTTLGIAGISALAGETADAATAVSATKATFMKTLFASKLNALITASMVTASALSGYAVHSIITDKPDQKIISSPVMHNNTQPVQIQTMPSEVVTPAQNNTNISHESAMKKQGGSHKNISKERGSVKVEPGTTISGTGGASMQPPDLGKPKK